LDIPVESIESTISTQVPPKGKSAKRKRTKESDDEEKQTIDYGSMKNDPLAIYHLTENIRLTVVDQMLLPLKQKVNQMLDEEYKANCIKAQEQGLPEPDKRKGFMVGDYVRYKFASFLFDLYYFYNHLGNQIMLGDENTKYTENDLSMALEVVFRNRKPYEASSMSKNLRELMKIRRSKRKKESSGNEQKLAVQPQTSGKKKSVKKTPKKQKTIATEDTDNEQQVNGTENHGDNNEYTDEKRPPEDDAGAETEPEDENESPQITILNKHQSKGEVKGKKLKKKLGKKKASNK